MIPIRLVTLMVAYLAMAAILSSCRDNHRNRAEFHATVIEESDTTSSESDFVIEAIERMRGDMDMRSELSDYLTRILGINVTCVDPVTHIYDGDGRRFHWNNEFGDILEIPNDWIPSFSIYGLLFPYHGEPVCSPDSTCWLSPFSGYSAIYVTEKEFYEGIRKEYEKSSLIYHKGHPIYQILANGEKRRIHWAEGVSKDGCSRKKDYWSIVLNENEPTVDYTLSLKVLQNTPDSVKNIIMKYYNEYPLRTFP